MAINLFSLYTAFSTFRSNHREVFPFMKKAVQTKDLKEGSVMKLSITAPDGTVSETEITVKSSDMKLFNYLTML